MLSAFHENGLKIGSMDNWVKEGGYPVVTVKRDKGNVLLSQSRFLVDGKASSTRWTIPITYATKIHNKDYSKTTPDTWMEQTVESTTMLNAFKNTEMIILNVQGSGYYRVNYDNELMERINGQLRTDTKGGVIPINRAILIDDAMNMARVGLQSYDLALNLTTYLVEELDYYPWVAAFNSFEFLNKRIASAEVLGWFKDYVTRMSAKFYENASFYIDFSKAEHIEILRTVLALQRACDLGVEACLTDSMELFAAYVEKPNVNLINANVRSVVYCNGIRQGAEVEWEFLFAKYVASSSTAEKDTIVSALGCSKVKEIVENFLAKSLAENDEIRRHHVYSVFTSVVNGNPENFDIALNFVINNFKEIRIKYPSMTALSNVFNDLADRFTTTAQIDKFQAFLKANEGDLGEAVEVGQSVLITAEANLAWTKKFQPTIRSWLEQERIKSKGTGTDKGNCNGAVPITTVSVLTAIMASFVMFYH